VSEIQILATGPELVREGLRGIEPVMQEIILGANKEIQIVGYVFTPQANHMLMLVRQAAEKGISVTFVVNNFDSQNERIKSELLQLRKNYPRVKVVDFHDREGRQLHAKVVVADRKSAVIGSANFSWGGMVANYEIGVLIVGDAAWKLAQVIDRLAVRAQ
jgi:cardiolipin synthase